MRTINDFREAVFNAHKKCNTVIVSREFADALLYLVSTVEMATYNVKSCRAGDGDTRTWKECACDVEAELERALMKLGGME
jgi:hypothetical protein